MLTFKGVPDMEIHHLLIPDYSYIIIILKKLWSALTFMSMPKVLMMMAHWNEGLGWGVSMSVTHPWPWRGCFSVMRHSRPTAKDPLLALHQLCQCTLMSRRRRRGCPRGEGMEYRLPHTSRTRTYNETTTIKFCHFVNL